MVTEELDSMSSHLDLIQRTLANFDDLFLHASWCTPFYPGPLDEVALCIIELANITHQSTNGIPPEFRAPPNLLDTWHPAPVV